MTHDPGPRPTPEEQIDRIQRMFDGFSGLYVLNTGLKTGLFAQLAAAPGSSPDELAAALHLHPRYVRVWCDTAYAAGLLEATDERRFRLGQYYDLLLGTPGGPHELASSVDFYVDVVGEDFRRHPEALRDGAVYRYQERGAAFSHHIGVLTSSAQAAFIDAALPRLPRIEARLRAGAAVVDIGCGVGNLVRALARAYPASRFLGIDIDTHGIALARKRLAGEPEAAARVTFEERGGDSLAAYEGEFDLALLFQALHEIDDDARPRLIAACGRALRDDGALVIVDHTYPETVAELRDPAFRMAATFEWFEMLWGNRTQTHSEIVAMLHEAGFGGVETVPFPETGFQIIIARPGPPPEDA